MPKFETGLLHLRRIDPARNMARFYVLFIQPTLFGGASLIRNWGGSDGTAKPKSRLLISRKSPTVRSFDLSAQSDGEVTPTRMLPVPIYLGECLAVRDEPTQRRQKNALLTPADWRSGSR